MRGSAIAVQAASPRLLTSRSSYLPAWSRHILGLQNSDRIQAHTRAKSFIARPGEQAVPLKGYYADILSQPDSPVQASSKKTPSSSLESSTSDPKEEPSGVRANREDVQARARVVFGSRLAGPIERQARFEASKSIAGVLVPPKPLEPDNCCMSGCVNCVWDQYREDLEDWAAKSAKATAAIQAQQHGVQGADKRMGTVAAGVVAQSHGVQSMDEDGGASEVKWSNELEDDDAMLAGIPVGIREFMKTEKRLKEKHERDSGSHAGA